MSNKIKSPNEKGNGFIWSLVALLVIVAAVVGYVVYNGKQAEANKYADRPISDVAFTGTYADNMITLKADNVAADAPVVDLYEDYSCIHCSELAKATDADMKAAIEAGKIVVNINGLNFLDKAEDGNSTKAGAAALTILKAGDIKTYWNFRELLFQDQQTIYGQWQNEDFATTAAALGASEGVVNDIRNGVNMAEFREVATANATKLEQAGGSVSSPRVFVDGNEFTDNLHGWVSAVAP